MKREEHLRDIAVRIGSIAALSEAIKEQMGKLNRLYGIEILETSQMCNNIHVFAGIEMVAEAFNEEMSVDTEYGHRYFYYNGTKVLQVEQDGKYRLANYEGNAMYDLSEVE